jgi:alpha-glucosidase (family GH31 glycosyl hydrolase)
MQDWVGLGKFPEGTRLLWNWQLNKNQYPDWDGMVDKWEKDGVRPMIYMNPYFANLTGNPQIRANYFKEADDNGYFVKKRGSNDSYLIQSISIEFG